MRQQVTTSVDNILSLVSCADGYGFGGSVFYDGMAEMLGYECSDEEIEACASDFLTEESRVARQGDPEGRRNGYGLA